jgi:tRNA threonylcarbamoyladenosine biosynthesis protein TsaB
VSRILAIDTASARCSAALRIDGATLVREEDLPRGHAERLLPMVESLLAEAGTNLGALDAIAFGRGPGSFTGLRIAASVAQGLAVGAGLGVAPVSDLAALAHQAWRRHGALRMLAALDARMGEVYVAAYRADAHGALEPALAEALAAPDALLLPDGEGWFLVGRGADAAAGALRLHLGARLAGCDGAAEPSAFDVAALGARLAEGGVLVAPGDAQPVYLRDRVAEPSSR